MCLICSDLSKGRIKIKEARRNLQEMGDSLTHEHRQEIQELITEIEKEQFELSGAD